MLFWMLGGVAFFIKPCPGKLCCQHQNNNELQQSRWALICVLCRERVGACIQCSIKTCKTAYHVTCAFKYGLEMKAIIEDEMADDGVKLRVSYCIRSKFIKIIVSRLTIDQSDNFIFLVVLSKA